MARFEDFPLETHLAFAIASGISLPTKGAVPPRHAGLAHELREIETLRRNWLDARRDFTIGDLARYWLKAKLDHLQPDASKEGA